MFYCDLLFQNKLSSTVSLVILGLQVATMRGTDNLHMTATINHLCFEDFECLNIMSPISSQCKKNFSWPLQGTHHKVVINGKLWCDECHLSLTQTVFLPTKLKNLLREDAVYHGQSTTIAVFPVPRKQPFNKLTHKISRQPYISQCFCVGTNNTSCIGAKVVVSLWKTPTEWPEAH